MRYAPLVIIGLLAFLVLGWEGEHARASHDPGGGDHIDQISIDVGPPDIAQGVSGNGKPAAGDRNGDGVFDAEGYGTPSDDDLPGTCGNNIDDDGTDADFDGVVDSNIDGVADDGCVVTLTPLETCVEIIDDGVLNADEDSQEAGQDRASIDITVGSSAGGGIPANRLMHDWQYQLDWDIDVIDIDVHNGNFLILASGGASPFIFVVPALPKTATPFVAAVTDAGPPSSGPGVISRLTIEGNGAGIADLTLSNFAFQDLESQLITIDTVNSARVAVSKDGPDAGATIGDSPGELFLCPKSIDQISIDVGPPGVAQDVNGNGKPAVGDRDGDGIFDAEGYDSRAEDDLPGVCGNNTDDDGTDADFDGVVDSNIDGVADDGCVVTLTPLETCVEIVDDGVLNADEDSQEAGQDRASIDITVGSSAGGGIPTHRRFTTWRYDLGWDVDVLDIDAHNGNFLILASGGGSPFSVITDPLPKTATPFIAAISDAGPSDSGPGVISRITIEGNGAGIASLTLSNLEFYDPAGNFITIDTANSAQVAVSKDGADSGSTIGDSLGELIPCPGPADPDDDRDGVNDVDEQNCGGHALDPARRPERLDGPFANIDDDGDAQVDEPLPTGSEGFDCDGDGYLGSWEMGIFAAPGTANDQDPCGNNGWPAELTGDDNKMTIAEFNSFITPFRADGSFNKFFHPVPDPADPAIGRWDIRQPTNGVIDIADLNRLNPGVTSQTARPPMFKGLPAFFTDPDGAGPLVTGECPWPA